ncbi:histidine kinase [Microtetraspora sp. NBRC 13810]|uniref:sensor histidine kinase n=1 Tax=Microtetraspora sp. NBRC 13810 TaxID=3030990 RepID=UPI002553219C|nr:histidine kinase [Microtetraspora sp. NBRC 13810]
MAVLAFATGLVLLAGNAFLARVESPYLLVGPLLVTCLGVAVRRRAPMLSLGLGVVAISADLVVGPSLPTVLIFTDNLYAATLYGPRWATKWLLGVTSVLAVVAGALAGFSTLDWRALAVGIVQAGLVLLTPVSTAIILRQHRDQAEAERTRAEQVARLAELDRRAAVNTERTRMARELHDMIANHFSAIAIQSTAVLSRKDLDGRAVHGVLESIRENSLQGMTEMRTMIELLRQEGQQEAQESEATRRRLADLGDLVERSRRSGVVTRLHISGTPRELPAAVDLAGYRIVQEALTNVLKHGDKQATVTIGYESHQVTLNVDNPVSGRSSGLPGSGAGVIGMRERVALLGGVFEAGLRGQLWRVRADLPTEIPEAPDRKRKPAADTPVGEPVSGAGNAGTAVRTEDGVPGAESAGGGGGGPGAGRGVGGGVEDVGSGERL